MGRADLNGSGGAEYGLTRIVVHPNYVKSTGVYDVALLFLDGYSTATPLPLAPTPALYSARGVTLYGYGTVDSAGNETRQLRRTPDHAYRVDGCAAADVLPTRVCFFRQNTNVEVLPGDSGAPWVVWDRGGWIHLATHHGFGPNVETGTNTYDLLNWFRTEGGLLRPQIGQIVRDPTTSETWRVGNDGFRYRIPTGGDYECFVAQGARSVNLPRELIEQIPLASGTDARCTPAVSDRDADGTPDPSDACPDSPGPASNAGCPVAVPSSTVVIANTGGIGVRLRNSPTMSDVKGNGPLEGVTVGVQCYTGGEAVGGNTLWYLISWNGTSGYIPAYYTNAPSRPGWLTTACTNVPAPPPPGLINGGYESANTGWIITYNPGGVVNRSVWTFPGRARSGTGFLEANTSIPGGSVGQDTNVVPTPGNSYALRVWVKDPTGSPTPFNVNIALWALGGVQEVATTEAQIGREWTPVDVVLRPNNSGHTRLRVEFYMGTTNRNINFDDASLTITATDPAINTSNPIGSLDEVLSPQAGQIRVRGWSFDPNYPSASNDVHIYVGGQAGQPGAVGHNLGPASVTRPDVGAYAPYAGSTHGFDRVLTTTATGTVTVCAYGINLMQGNNVMLSNSCRSVTMAPARPAFDSISAPCRLTAPAASLTATTVNATHEASEPDHDLRGTASSIWCRVTSTKHQRVRITTAGSGYDTVIALYRGSTISGLSPIASNDDSNGTLQSTIDVWLDPGVTYSLAIDGYGGGSGVVSLSMTYLESPDSYATPCRFGGSGISSVSFPTTGFTSEPTHDPDGPVAMAFATRTAWCVYEAPADGVVTFSTAGSDFDTLLVDYSASEPTGVWSYNDDWNFPDLSSRITRNVTAGEQVLLTIAGTDDATGNLQLSASLTGPRVRSLTPARVAETRPGLPSVDGAVQGGGRIPAGTVLEIPMAGRGGVAQGATAVMLNVTAVLPDGPGFLTVFPCGEPQPLASSVNYGAGDVVPNAVLAKIGANGSVCVYSSSTTDVVVDVAGYVPTGAAPAPVVPARLLDTRPGGPTTDDAFSGQGRAAAGTVEVLTVAGRGGVPADAVAVMLNVTAVGPDSAGFLTLFPCGTSIPLASNVNYEAGQVVPNAVLAEVGANGQVCIHSSASTDIVVDVNGYVLAGQAPMPILPARLVDTRPGGATVDGSDQGLGRVEADSVLYIMVTDRAGIPFDATAVMLNVTAVNPDAAGFLTVFPCEETRPLASNVNYRARQVVPNAVLAKVGAGGMVCVYSSAATDVVIDVNAHV